ncbi:uncharacterized protein BJX67DRAFT_376301 [Aspergillus lucknowensis]|uniref:PD-(D/E)XK endonuclease-like domain-containing protein n=1 Tax=Aspergillus lucknowensis TaxID=176173 RepID=A0ABR4M7F3_9EURO
MRNKAGKRNPEIPTIAITDIHAGEVELTFGLKRDVSPGIWTLESRERRTIPEHLGAILADYALAYGGSPDKEAFARARLDAILCTTLAAKKRQEFGQCGQDKGMGKWASVQSIGSFKSLHWETEMPMKLPWTYLKKPHIISGKTDYSLFYVNRGEAETNMVIVEAKKRVNIGKFQAMAYMAMLHHARKKAGRANTTIYGIATDSYDWCFLRFDPQGKISSHVFD